MKRGEFDLMGIETEDVPLTQDWDSERSANERGHVTP